MYKKLTYRHKRNKKIIVVSHFFCTFAASFTLKKVVNEQITFKNNK